MECSNFQIIYICGNIRADVQMHTQEISICLSSPALVIKYPPYFTTTLLIWDQKTS